MSAACLAPLPAGPRGPRRAEPCGPLAPGLLALGVAAAPAAGRRFLVADARNWRAKLREPMLLARLATDPHAPPRYRTNGPVAHLPAFHEAFDLRPGDRLYRAPAQRLQVWWRRPSPTVPPLRSPA